MSQYIYIFIYFKFHGGVFFFELRKKILFLFYLNICQIYYDEQLCVIEEFLKIKKNKKLYIFIQRIKTKDIIVEFNVL